METTLWTIRAALLFFASAVMARLCSHWKFARSLWTLGTVLYIVHVAAAFHYIHGWSHADAINHTAEVSEEFTGARFGHGIWFNHLFTILCVTETIWWWADEQGYKNRSRWISVAIFSYLWFIAINGAVVFAPAPTRWIALSVAFVIAAKWVSLLYQAKNHQEN